jgi:hypothetical protein
MVKANTKLERLLAQGTKVYKCPISIHHCCGLIAAAVLLLLLPMGLCLAQTTLAPQMDDPKACSNDQRLRLGNGQPRDPSNKTLSEKLDRTEGVLCPPNVDPGIRAPTPEVGKMPIIPPPGSPGGEPTVRPK